MTTAYSYDSMIIIQLDILHFDSMLYFDDMLLRELTRVGTRRGGGCDKGAR